MRKTLVLAAAAISLVAFAQLVQPTSYTQTPVNAWNATHGSLFDAGLVCGTTTPMGIIADQLSSLECQQRMLTKGVDGEASNIVSIYEAESLRYEDGPGTRLIAVHGEFVGLDGGVETGLGGAISACLFWRPLAGGDAGLQWSLKTTGVLATNSSAGARATGFYSASPYMPGYYCFVPTGGGYGLDRVWMRLSRTYQPRAFPR